MSLSKPTTKHLRYTEKHFEDYWIQITTIWRSHEATDLLLDDIHHNPIMALYQHHKDTVHDMYQALNLSWPPSTSEWLRDPIGITSTFLSTSRNAAADDDLDEATTAYIAAFESAIVHIKSWVSAQKHIWATGVATLEAGKTMILIRGYKYGAGLGLMHVLQQRQTRQTAMSLFAVFGALITVSLSDGEELFGLFARIEDCNQRLMNWVPPIVLPEQLLLVCTLRALPTNIYGPTVTIIMAKRPAADLETCHEMLLDAENADATRTTAKLGSSKTGSGLVATPSPRADRRLDRNVKPTANYLKHGACSVHGPNCKHGDNDCYIQHPDKAPKGFRPRKQRSGATASVSLGSATVVSKGQSASSAYGFSLGEGYSAVPISTPTNRQSGAVFDSYNGDELFEDDLALSSASPPAPLIADDDIASPSTPLALFEPDEDACGLLGLTAHISSYYAEIHSPEIDRRATRMSIPITRRGPHSISGYVLSGHTSPPSGARLAPAPFGRTSAALSISTPASRGCPALTPDGEIIAYRSDDDEDDDSDSSTGPDNPNIVVGLVVLSLQHVITNNTPDAPIVSVVVALRPLHNFIGLFRTASRYTNQAPFYIARIVPGGLQALLPLDSPAHVNLRQGLLFVLTTDARAPNAFNLPPFGHQPHRHQDPDSGPSPPTTPASAAIATARLSSASLRRHSARPILDTGATHHLTSNRNAIKQSATAHHHVTGVAGMSGTVARTRHRHWLG